MLPAEGGRGAEAEAATAATSAASAPRTWATRCASSGPALAIWASTDALHLAVSCLMGVAVALRATRAATSVSKARGTSAAQCARSGPAEAMRASAAALFVNGRGLQAGCNRGAASCQGCDERRQRAGRLGHAPRRGLFSCSNGLLGERSCARSRRLA